MQQLQKFSGGERKEPRDWLDAFFILEDYLQALVGWNKDKKVVFLDELPWMASENSDAFLRAFGSFWNSWASQQNIVIVICGSATSWIVQKVIFHKGGLHNRITKLIQVYPFNLKETEEYFKSRYLDFTRYQIVQLYMAMGGIPHYLKEIKRGRSAIQNIDEICFAPLGLLRTEFSKLYAALFQESEKHVAVVRTLATKNKGMKAQEVVDLANKNFREVEVKLRTLEELEQSGFLTSYFPFNTNTKNKFYRLTDEYSLFYLHFMEDKTNEGAGTWQYLSQTQAYKIWSGYAFESICMKHIPQIKKALGISGVYSKTSSFLKKGTKKEKGTQIDLVIDRNDHVISLIEIKFHNKRFTVSKDYAAKLRQKKWVFEEVTETEKLTMLHLITTFGIKQNEYSLELVQSVVVLDDLFE